MSNNIPKKLELKSQLLRHLDTAKKMVQENKPSSAFRVASLEYALEDLEMGFNPYIEVWDMFMVDK